MGYRRELIVTALAMKRPASYRPLRLGSVPAAAKRRLYQLLIKPRSKQEDSQRREYILNVLLAGALVLAVMAVAVQAFDAARLGANYRGGSVVTPVVFLLAVGGLIWLSRSGWHRTAAAILIGLFALMATLTLYMWSIDVGQGLLIYALVIVMSGILLGSRAAVFVTAAVAVLMGLLAAGQQYRVTVPDMTWLKDPSPMIDVIPYIITFGIIFLVSWLSSREIDRSLGRARRSEAALRHERDNLEILVAERTRQLEQAQRDRILELQRFAEFGRVSAGLLHDIANPVSAASLNLEQVSGKQRTDQVSRAAASVQYLERYVTWARKQLQNSSEIKTFNISEELEQVLHILTHKAKSIKVELKVDCPADISLHGDPIKFHQVAANLIANAIDSYENRRSAKKREIQISVAAEAKDVVMTVKDWGAGIAEQDAEGIFQPFYSTKLKGGRSTGLGLALVKEMVEHDFHGSITVASAPRQGTECRVVMRSGRSARR